MQLTKYGAFNFCIPSAVSAVDKDNNGYIDTIYFGNVAGHMFKVDTSNSHTNNWKTYSLYRKDLTTNLATGTITGITITTGLPADIYMVSNFPCIPARAKRNRTGLQGHGIHHRGGPSGTRRPVDHPGNIRLNFCKPRT